MKESTKIEQVRFHADIYAVKKEACPTYFPTHWHQFVECIALFDSDASVTIRINENPVTLNTGDILFIWPGELHEITDNHSSAMYAFQFPLSLINDKKEFASYHTLYRRHPILTYKQNPQLNDEIITELKKILEISDVYSTPFRNIRMTISVYEIFMKIALSLRELERNSTHPLMAKESNQIIDKINLACSYIAEHCTEDLSQEEVASFVGFSVSYFSRHFKIITNHSYVEYLNIQRVNRLQILLTDKTISITEAAYQAGFNSSSTLNRIFSKYCGCTPREYRNLHSS